MLRLEPMDDAEFEAFVDRSLPRRAAKWVERGIWTEAGAPAASRQVYAERLPKGRATPGNYFLKIVGPSTSVPVGELWYTAKEQGGKVLFWVEWIQIEPEHRQKGYATEVLRMLEEVARGLGADRIGLTVWTDNPNAQRLYSKLGYVSANVNMTKSLPASS